MRRWTPRESVTVNAPAEPRDISRAMTGVSGSAEGIGRPGSETVWKLLEGIGPVNVNGKVMEGENGRFTEGSWKVHGSFSRASDLLDASRGR